ncbi:heme-binding beta-barrel domain-containing protein [Marinobacterium arenosum]|uniref:heme-binding beta-barrel domain-containing protein n=1 Tax=Marinobacterium arenosum TaxID=2862496 RepID=UPI001C989888|nr:heme-binding beta-barrel domain-containing protein [Marinobacterium arenosum]MBY4675322.1 heme-binding beta-barrel domain-containing protein [Marinobacterium arenosum]
MAKTIKLLAVEHHPEVDVDLGPLSALVGTWIGSGLDLAPTPDGTLETPYREELTFSAIPSVQNGPQKVYGLQYWSRLSREDDLSPLYQETGYWLWMPLQQLVVRQFVVPNGVAVMAGGEVAADAKRIEVTAEKGSTTFGILHSPFLEDEVPMVRFSSLLDLSGNVLRYEELSVLDYRDQIYEHVDRARLIRAS